MKRVTPLFLATCLGAFAGTDSPGIEIPAGPAAESSAWSVRAALYGWAQSLEGDVTVRGIDLPLDLKFKDLAEDLDMAAMGLIEITRGHWGLLVDVNYADISDSVATPAGIIAPSVHFSQKQWLVNAYLTRDLIHDGKTSFDVFAGARLNALELELEFNDRNPSRDTSWVDPVIGLRFQRMLTSTLFVRAVGDIGGFGVSSDLTWQAMAGLGWKFNGTGSALLGYRAIDTDYSHGGFGYDVKAFGPVLGLEFSF